MAPFWERGRLARLELPQPARYRQPSGAARQDAQTVREVLLQSVDPTVEGLLRTPVRPSKASTLAVMLDKIAGELRDAPVLSDEAFSCAGIYPDQAALLRIE